MALNRQEIQKISKLKGPVALGALIQAIDSKDLATKFEQFYQTQIGVATDEQKTLAQAWCDKHLGIDFVTVRPYREAGKGAKPVEVDINNRVLEAAYYRANEKRTR